MKDSRAVLPTIEELKFHKSLSPLDISLSIRANRQRPSHVKTLTIAIETITDTKDVKITTIGRLLSKEESTVSERANRNETTEAENDLVVYKQYNSKEPLNS
jgi:hypothetical protein